MHAKLVVVGGKANRNEIKLKLPTTLGRGREAGIVIAHPMVSRQHCEFYEEDGVIFVRDLGSLNGTLVDDEQVQRGRLDHGSKVTVGPLTFQLVFEHLGAINVAPAKPAESEDDSAIGQPPPPELAQTVVDLPRIGPSPLDEPRESLALPDLPDDDGFDLELPSAEDLPAAQAPVVDEPNLFGDDDDDLGFDVGPSDKPSEEPSELSSPAEVTLDLHHDDADDLGFDLGPEPEAAVEELEELPPPVKEDIAPAATASVQESEADPFLEMIGEETSGVESVGPSAPVKEAEEELLFDAPGGEPELEVDAIPEAKADEDELDWLKPDLAGDLPANDDIAEFVPAADFPAGGEEIVEELVEDLSFDDPAAADTIELPTAEAPIVASEPAPVAPKKKRGFWPFGRKKKAADEANEEEPVAAAPIEIETDTPTLVGAETVVMEALDLSAFGEPETTETPEDKLTQTQEFAHEKTVVIDDLPTAIEEVAMDEAVVEEIEEIVLPAAAEAPVEKKAKRGLFSFGKKKKVTEAVSEEVADIAPAVEEKAAVVPAASESVEETVVAEPTKKRGWFGLGKNKKQKQETPPAEEPAPTPTPAAAPPPAHATPSPESFEFSDDELLEITAETAPPTAKTPPSPQALAADEVLDFELDLPLEDSAASIQPVLSDEPTPTTGADDDDFLDFLAEELPSAKPKRGGG